MANEATENLYKNTVIRVRYMNEQIQDPITTN